MNKSLIAGTLALMVVLGGAAPAAQAMTTTTSTTVVAPGAAELLSQIKKLQSMLELYKGDRIKMRMKDDCVTATSTAMTASTTAGTSTKKDSCERREEIKTKYEDKKKEIKSKIEDRKGSSSMSSSTRDKNRGSMASTSKTGVKATKQITKAEAELAEVKAELGSSTEPQAVVTLIRNGETKLAEAKARFAEGKYGVAAVLAKSAERSAKRADSLLEDSSDDEDEDEDDN
jgi:hypothetical protein